MGPGILGGGGKTYYKLVTRVATERRGVSATTRAGTGPLLNTPLRGGGEEVDRQTGGKLRGRDPHRVIA